MPGRSAVDTNLLVYASFFGRTDADAAKSLLARDMLRGLIVGGEQLLAPIQVLVELHDVLVRKGGLTRAEAGAEVNRWQQELGSIATDRAVLAAALELSTRHQLRIFDAVVLAAAAEARCNRLLSEDFQSGFAWRGVEVVNPFA